VTAKDAMHLQFFRSRLWLRSCKQYRQAKEHHTAQCEDSKGRFYFKRFGRTCPRGSVGDESVEN
jgi:hypothetical protein